MAQCDTRKEVARARGGGSLATRPGSRAWTWPVCRRIADGDAKVGTENQFGDEQLQIDVHADEVIFSNFKKCGAVACASSEEQPEELDMGCEAKYSQVRVA